ncbi:PREDICTED: LRR receptor-like serine/threonine-protein kinase ERL1 [Tarenaya hassleriana]|uniref:LRR receptor-like serine/threonine-protein kinase ERL1 n=1 Tax=Tarenaya hassleriana TaxID=28532 RepID=UPI00053C4D8C|nr:PREDICTED: LRR receptor-like serine/threonine-protein kinase ERL1 [Tarenaya hassleriana]
MSFNRFSGKIPVGIGNLAGMIGTPRTYSAIENLFMFSMEFSELMVNWKKAKQSLPSQSLEIYSLLNLSNNMLSGVIPASVGKLKGLKILNVSFNNLTGNIPISFGDIESLESMDLSHNMLSGKIPQSFSRLQQLTTLDLSNNKLQGPIPVYGQMSTMNDPTIYTNNSGLCGWQIQVKCPEEVSLPEPKPEESEEDAWPILLPKKEMIKVPVFSFLWARQPQELFCG